MKETLPNRYRMTYLIDSILGVTGGNITLLKQVNAMVHRGHDVSILTFTPRPAWICIDADVIKVPTDKPLHSCYQPPCDVVVATYFTNAIYLPKVDAPLRLYYAQGDQYIFDDQKTQSDRNHLDDPRVATFKRLSELCYKLPGVRFIPNSNNLAACVRERYGVEPDGVIPVGVDHSVYRPLSKSPEGQPKRILIVGPDIRSQSVEPIDFKGIQDIRDALAHLDYRREDFEVIRIANTPPDIFADYADAYYQVPVDSVKTQLYGHADILIYASHYDSCPRPPLEGMAAGAAVVCTDTSGAREYCVDGENCLLVPIRSPESIAEVVARLLDDTALRQDLAAGGLKTAASRPESMEWDALESIIVKYLGPSEK